MNRKFLTFIFVACCALVMSAQDAIRVKYQGSKPTISDFVGAMLNDFGKEREDDCCNESANAMLQAWKKHIKGAPLSKGEKLTVDEKNGYVCYESRYEENLLRIEMCYWNEADKKHKLVAYNVTSFNNGKCSPGQFDGLTFYRYNNATKKMTMAQDTGFDVIYFENGAHISYDLPRSGKDIVANYWFENGKKTQKTIKWNGSRFK